MDIFPSELKIESRMDKYLFLEAMWNTGAGMVGQIKNLISDFLVGGIVLKIFGITQYWWLLPIIGFVYLISVFILGFFMQRKNIIVRRGGLMNRISNPQLMEILDKMKQ